MNQVKDPSEYQRPQNLSVCSNKLQAYFSPCPRPRRKYDSVKSSMPISSTIGVSNSCGLSNTRTRYASGSSSYAGRYQSPCYGQENKPLAHAPDHPYSSSRHDSTISSSTSSNDPRCVCLWPGCSYATSRQFDLQRHIIRSHDPTPPVQKTDCPGKSCGRTSIYGFHRADHLKSHLQNSHSWDIPKGRSMSYRNDDRPARQITHPEVSGSSKLKCPKALIGISRVWNNVGIP